jgi:hypothetical protein
MQALREVTYAEAVDRLTPLGFDDITILGRYRFEVPEAVRRSEFRPLRHSSVGDATDERST